MIDKNIPKSVVARLPLYLHYLRSVSADRELISSSAVARAVRLGEVQVRKDLAMVSGKGKPKTGYVTAELVDSIMEVLGCVDGKNAVIVGAGHLGAALLAYKGFSEYNIRIIGAFDSDEKKRGTDLYGKSVMAIEEMSDYCKHNDVSIGIITVPEGAAQEVCDRLIEAGIRTIWSFAPIRLEVPDYVRLKEENMAASLSALAANV